MLQPHLLPTTLIAISAKMWTGLFCAAGGRAPVSLSKVRVEVLLSLQQLWWVRSGGAHAGVTLPNYYGLSAAMLLLALFGPTQNAFVAVLFMGHWEW